ncbi:hypothetical protein COLO4_00001, partial [Corchorus olitorius]
GGLSGASMTLDTRHVSSAPAFRIPCRLRYQCPGPGRRSQQLRAGQSGGGSAGVAACRRRQRLQLGSGRLGPGRRRQSPGFSQPGRAHQRPHRAGRGAGALGARPGQGLGQRGRHPPGFQTRLAADLGRPGHPGTRSRGSRHRDHRLLRRKQSDRPAPGSRIRLGPDPAADSPAPYRTQFLRSQRRVPRPGRRFRRKRSRAAPEIP